MYRRRLVTALALVALGLGTSAALGAHNNARHTTYLTFSRPVGLPGVTLGAGTYIFEVPDLYGDHNIVRVLNRDRSMVLFTAFTDPVARPKGMSPDHPISLGESETGVAQPIQVWWPEGPVGRRFIYASPK